MLYPQILQSRRSDIFHRQKESRDSGKALSCLLFSFFRGDRCSLGSLSSQDSGPCGNVRSLKISPDTQSMRIPCQFLFYRKPTFLKHPTQTWPTLYKQNFARFIANDLRKLQVHMMPIQQRTLDMYSFSDKETKVGPSPTLQFLLWSCWCLFLLYCLVVAQACSGISSVVSQETADLCTDSFLQDGFLIQSVQQCHFSIMRKPPFLLSTLHPTCLLSPCRQFAAYSKAGLLLDKLVCKIEPWHFRAGRIIRDHTLERPHFTDEETEAWRAGDMV